jgi:hypothetical protein
MGNNMKKDLVLRDLKRLLLEEMCSRKQKSTNFITLLQVKKCIN